MTMYVRVSQLSVVSVRTGRNFSKTAFLVLLALTVFTFFFLMALMTDNHVTDSEIFYRQNSNKTVSNAVNDSKCQLVELPTWGFNVSTSLEDYIDPSNPDTFIWEPDSTRLGFNNDTSAFCGPTVKILILVASAPGNSEARRAIRDTWGSNILPKGIRLIFVLGNSDNNVTEASVAQEAKNYGDMLEEDFIDTYHNLTLKSMAMLKWVQSTCSLSINNTSASPKFVLKTDDDIFINTDRLLKIAHDMPNAKMIGRLTCGASPISKVSDKLYMPKYLYPGKVYPGYLSGTGYMLQGNIIPILLQNSKVTPLIHLEDIYVTALLARQSKIFPTDSPFFTYSPIDPKDKCAFRYMVNAHQIKPNQMRYIWSQLKKPPPNCPPKSMKFIRKIPRQLNKRLRNLCLFN